MSYLVTYRDGKYWNFEWFETEEELLEWLGENKNNYDNVEANEFMHVRSIYEGK